MKEHYNIRNILVPVDFSERSKNAVIQSTYIAKAKDSNIILYHAYSRPPDGTNLSAFEIEHRLQLKKEKVKESFKIFTDSIPELINCKYETKYEVGISTQNIENMFKDSSTDLMVMATHGAKGVELMWGSKTTNLINRLKGPILVIPDNASLLKPKKLALAYNFDLRDQNIYALSTLKQLANAFGAHIRILDVRPNNYPKTEHRLKEEAKISLYLGEETSHDFESIFSRDVELALIDYVHEYEIDLLAIMPAEHSFFEKLFHQSLTELMASKIDIPLLTLVDK